MSSGFYLYGDHLSPIEITGLLGIEPTRAHLKGDVVVGTTTGRPYAPRRTGLWSYVKDAEGDSVEEFVAKILGHFDRVDRDLSALPNVTRANFDLFVIGTAGPERGLLCEFEFSPQQVLRLAQLGVFITLAIGTSATSDE
jgi:hypothetical protein